MVCDLRLAPKQTIQQRAEEVRRAVSGLDALLKKRRVRPVVGPQGAIAFAGWETVERAGISDACAYRLLMRTGSVLAKAEIARAEQMSGRQVNRQVIGQGVHSHDGGNTWHPKG
jgi:hypothetical protein